MIKATIGGEPLEIWFTPSFNIKTTNKEIDFQLRNLELEVFDLWSLRSRVVKATKGEIEAYLILDKLKDLLPELNIEITEYPELPNSEAGSEDNPTLH
jgi:hypothetical protein